jgi:hypothetical protein
MRQRRTGLCALLVFTAVLAPRMAAAQFHTYPSFQIPRVSVRDYNFGIGDAGDGGSTLLFQWREGTGPRTHLQFDAGLADPEGGGDMRFVIGGSLGRQVRDGDNDLPLDMLFTVGIGGSFGDGFSLLRIPFGLSVGHTFLLDDPISISPYAHPRLSLDYCSRCGGGGDSDTDFGVDVDLGVDVRVARTISIRASVMLAGSDFVGRDDAFGLSLVWLPPGLR